MKKFSFKKVKLSVKVVALVSAVLAAGIAAYFLSPLAAAQSGKFYPEPESRPNIPEDAFWDSELGMYISGDCVKNENGQYEVDTSVFEAGGAEDRYEKWLKTHQNSDNEIDQAILYSVELLLKEPPTFLSAISPRTSEAILTAMSTLSVSSYPEIWERICVEPAYRPQKFVALERFLSITFDVGLYDKSGQREWFNLFNDLREELAEKTFEEITESEVEQYGNLLLPTLMEKAKEGTLRQSELEVFGGMAQQVDRIADSGAALVSIDSPQTAAEWFDAHSEVVDAVTKILQSDYEWVE